MSAKETTKGFMAEFRKFIARGNVMDLAVGVIIGGAFQSIVTSLVNDIINPILGIFAGDGTNLGTALVIPLPGGGALLLGSFLNAVINFFLMALIIFFIVKGINSFYRKKETPQPSQPAKPTQEDLLAEIRDLLKEQHHD